MDAPSDRLETSDTAGGGSAAEVAQQAAGPAAVADDAPLVHDARAIHPHAVETDGRGVEAARARRQIVDPALVTARHGLRIEQEHVRPRTRHQRAAILDPV